MKKVSTIVLLFSCFLFIFSCSDDCFVDCIGEEPTLYFKILSKIDSTDLVFGDNKSYDADALEAYSLESNDTLKYDIKSNLIDVSRDRLMSFDFGNFNVSTIYLDYGDSDIDTLTLSYTTLETECCGDIKSINSVLQNGIESQDGFLTILTK